MRNTMRTIRLLACAALLALSLQAAIQYSGTTIINTTFTQTLGTRREIVDNVSTQLQAAGWTVATGSAGDITLKSLTTPQNYALRLRLYDPGGANNCAQLIPQSADGLIVGTYPMYLLPAVGKTWRIIANGYQVFVFTQGMTAAREFVAAGTLWAPTWLSLNALVWAHGNALTDATTTVAASYRTALNSTGQTFILAGTWYWSASPASTTGGEQLVFPRSSTSTVYRWNDDSAMIAEPLMAWGMTSAGDEAKLKGQLYDAAILSDTWISDQTIQFDSHNWYVLTNNNAAGTLVLMVP
jgi:hypothetical protein